MEEGQFRYTKLAAAENLQKKVNRIDVVKAKIENSTQPAYPYQMSVSTQSR